MTQNTLSRATSLRGRWLRIARAAWVVVALVNLTLFIASIPAYWAQLNTICTDPSGASCNFPQLNPTKLQALERLGATIGAYAVYTLTIHVAVSLVFFIVGALIFWRRSGDWYGLFVSLMLISFGTIGPSAVFSSALTWVHPELAPLDHAQTLIFPALGLFLVTFPDGRFVPRWSWAIVLLWVIQAVFWDVIDSLPPPLFVAELLLVWGGTLAVQIYRYKRVADAVQRQQTKWVLFGFALGVSTIVIWGLLAVVFPQLNTPDSRFWLLEGTWVAILFTSIPLAIGIALLRFRLWGIDPLINRTLVYGSLTVLLALFYFGSVTALQYLFSLLTGQGNTLAIVISTLAIAALFNPLRRRIQSVIDRSFYRRKYDAAKTLEEFGTKLRDQTDLEKLCEDLGEVVDETMQPAHVSVILRSEVPSTTKEQDQQDQQTTKHED
jgi:hypothetical protein